MANQRTIQVIAGVPILGGLVFGLVSGVLPVAWGIGLLVVAALPLVIALTGGGSAGGSHPVLDALLKKEDLSTDDLQQARAALQQQGMTGTPVSRFVGGYAKLRLMAEALGGTASKSAIATAEVSHLADQMDKRLDVQQEEVEKVAARVESITVTMQQVSVNASSVTDLATQAKEYSFTGRDELQEAISQMRDISSRTD
ncbi:MAG: methyl-accepting chemotaxis protein, partial [Oceanospirillum sp.]|nr:methyl-accepting chemotaxis protein [Oceanospirillum sp.]